MSEPIPIAVRGILTSQILEIVDRGHGGSERIQPKHFSQSRIVGTVFGTANVQAHYLRMAELRSFIRKQACDHHWRFDGSLSKLTFDRGLDRFDLRSTNAFAVELLPNLDDQILFSAGFPHRRAAIRFVDEWSFGSPTIATRPPISRMISRSGTVSVV